MTLAPGLAFAQGKVAVLNLEAAVFNTEEAKTQINALRQTPEYLAEVLPHMAEQRFLASLRDEDDMVFAVPLRVT